MNFPNLRSVNCTRAGKPAAHQKFKSAGNFLLFQLEASRFDRSARVGPNVHYTLKELFTDGESKRREINY